MHSQAPTAGSVDLAGILLKTAAYGLLRFSLAAVPERVGRVCANRHVAGCYRHLLWCVDGLRPDRYQTSDRLHLGFHMGFVLIAIYTGSQLAYQGAVIQMIAHGLSAAGLFILCGQLYERIHTRDMRMMGGLWTK